MRPYNPSNVLLPCDRSERDNSTDNFQLKLGSILYFHFLNLATNAMKGFFEMIQFRGVF